MSKKKQKEIVNTVEEKEEKESKLSKKRNYCYDLVIYEDDERFNDQFSALTDLKSAIWIRHDQDLTDDGEYKKAHYHFVLKLKTACTISALAKKISVDEHMIEPIKRSFNGALKYLVHFGRDDKYQYDIKEVESNDDELKRKFEKLVLNEIEEVDKVISIQEFIDQAEDYIDLGVLGKYVQKINYWDAFRRNMMYFCKLVDNHNAKISAKKYHIENDYYNSEVRMLSELKK